VAIISSGDEIVPLYEKPRPGQVRDSNAYLAVAQVAEWGGLPLMHGIIPDDFDRSFGLLKLSSIFTE
jgi:molybdopterin molybdotransferase